MYWPGSRRAARISPSHEESSTVAPPRSSSGCWEVVNSDARTNSVPPQLGQVGSSWAESSDTGASHSVQRKVPVPATLPEVQAFIVRLLGALDWRATATGRGRRAPRERVRQIVALGELSQTKEHASLGERSGPFVQRLGVAAQPPGEGRIAVRDCE